jgi:peptidyl-dipeptidase Dcp
VIETEHYRSAFDVALQEHESEIAAIVGNHEPPTFTNTIEALERAGQILRRIGGIFWNLASTDSTEAIREIERAVSPILARHFNEISLNQDLFSRVATIYEQCGRLDLNAEQIRLLELTYESFVRNGARLNPAERERIAAIAETLATLELKFAQNVLADETNLVFELEESDLAGVPDDVKAAFARAAAIRNARRPFALTLSRSNVEAFLRHADRRALREEIFRAWTERGAREGITDNREICGQILALRAERAKLLGFSSFAAYKLEPTMAARTQAALDLLNMIWAPALARSVKEREALQATANSSGANFKIGPHDWAYYAEKVRVKDFDLGQSVLSSYFQLNKMVEAAFYCAERLFGLQFIQRLDLQAYHPDVRVFEVRDRSGRHLAIFLGDYYARAGKRSGAWMSYFRGQKKLDEEVRPIIVNVMNFSQPDQGRPSLLTLTEVITLFHEFGHALHGILSDVVYPSMSGTATPADFVELPSQLFEHWALRPEVLRKFAVHHETATPITQDLIEAITASRNFNQGFATVEYCAAAFVDLLIHGQAEPPKDVSAAEKDILSDLEMPSQILPRHRTPHFAHIFSGDSYAAGYYSYLWSEALDADAFAAFEEKCDIFDQDVAGRLHEYIYAAGNQRDPNVAYALFRGRKPEFAALLRKKGFS